MEIKVYLSHDAFMHNKHVYCRRVDLGNFQLLFDAMKLLYGPDCIVTYVCV